MGRLAVIAEQHWKEHLPKAYAALKDKTAFFAEQEDEAERQIEELAETLEGEAPPDETYQQRMGRLMMARRDAESQVMREFLLPAPETTPEPENPIDRQLDDAAAQFAQARDELAAMQQPTSEPTTPQQ